MKTWYRHMAVYMIGFFLFPIVYQPIHQVHHHGHDKIEHSCEHHHERHQNKAAESAHIYHSLEHCPICEYEFVIQDLPCSAELVLATIPYSEQITFTFRGEVHKSAYSQKNPRGPPNT